MYRLDRMGFDVVRTIESTIRLMILWQGQRLGEKYALKHEPRLVSTGSLLALC